MMKYLLGVLGITLIGVAYIQHSNQMGSFLQSENERPIIGIFTQPSEWDEYPSTYYSYIASSYVKFVEQSGARVVPIPYDATEAALEQIFQNINGILIPGGATRLEGSQYTRSVAYMLNRAMRSNDLGDYFPIMAVCLGHEVVYYILSGYDYDALIHVSGEEGILHPIQNAVRTNVLYKDMSDNLFEQFTTQNISFYHHSYAISPKLFEKHQNLSELFEITGINTDSKNKVYIASSQGKKYPFVTTQYHSEKNTYEWEIQANHSAIAIQVTSAHSQAFVAMARQNHHSYASADDESRDMIYNSDTVHLKDSDFTEIYFVRNFQSPQIEI